MRHFRGRQTTCRCASHQRQVALTPEEDGFGLSHQAWRKAGSGAVRSPAGAAAPRRSNAAFPRQRHNLSLGPTPTFGGIHCCGRQNRDYQIKNAEKQKVESRKSRGSSRQQTFFGGFLQNHCVLGIALWRAQHDDGGAAASMTGDAGGPNQAGGVFGRPRSERAWNWNWRRGQGAARLGLPEFYLRARRAIKMRAVPSEGVAATGILPAPPKQRHPAPLFRPSSPAPDCRLRHHHKRLHNHRNSSKKAGPSRRPSNGKPGPGLSLQAQMG